MLLNIQELTFLNYRLFTEQIGTSATNKIFLTTFEPSQEKYPYAISFLEKRKRKFY